MSEGLLGGAKLHPYLEGLTHGAIWASVAAPSSDGGLALVTYLLLVLADPGAQSSPWQAEGWCSTVLGSTWSATTAGGLIAPSVSALPRGRLLGLARRERIGPLLTRCWVACMSSTNSWPLDLRRYGWSLVPHRHFRGPPRALCAPIGLA
jgi:hypothetical protein